jgi:pSer/pThr/pTyr-binding forkhead associated (FHA) protein
MIAKLIPLDGSPPISITRDITVVGRKQGLCDLFIDHVSISKLHCLIARTDGLLFFRDLGSTNGTKVNGQRVIRGALLPNDELSFAALKFRVFLGPGEPEVTSDDRTEMFEIPPRAVEEDPLMSDMTQDSAQDEDELIDSAHGEF